MDILVILAIFLLFLLGISLITYLFNALGLVAIARHRQLPGSELAWLPFLGTAYVTGAIADEQDRQTRGADRGLRYWLPGLSLALLILTIVLIALMFWLGEGYPANAGDPVFLLILFLNLIFGLPFTVLWYLAHFKLFQACQPNNSTAFLLLSIFFGLAPFLVFAVRHYVDGDRV